MFRPLTLKEFRLHEKTILDYMKQEKVVIKWENTKTPNYDTNFKSILYYKPLYTLTINFP